MALVLAGVATWAATYVAGEIAPSGETTATTSATARVDREWMAAAVDAAKGDPMILAAIQTRANENRIMHGDPDALAAFETVRPSGALTALPALGDPARGTFSPVVDWPLVGIHAVLTFDGRVLTYGTTTAGVRTGYYVYDIWDPLLGLGSDSHTVLPNATAVDIFCNAQLLLPDGNIEMWGGDVVNLDKGSASLQPNDDSNLFSPLDNSLARTGKMFRKRWYATATTLPNGEVYIQGGTGGEDFPEVRTSTGSFRLLTGASTTYLGALYPRNFVAPDGNIFGTRYEEMYRVAPYDAGAIKRAGRFPTSNMGASSTAVMFRPGKILQVGGGYDATSASPYAHVIDINPATPVIQEVARPIHPRHWGTSTMLADGRVFLSGGSMADNDPVNGVAYTSELYDPVANTWSEGATAQRMRLYHSAALLLPDATVLTLGGGAVGPQLNLNAEIYYPPYLFNADGTPASRPIITTAPMTTDPGGTIGIATPAPATITRVTLVKTGSVTHSLDMDQRFLELPFTVVGSELQAALPANPFETPPGFYMVFVIDDQGVPSEAAMLRINVQATALLTVNNVVVNDNGGSKVASDFSFSVNGWPPVAFEADGSNVLRVPAGTYAITELAVSGYTDSLADCSGIVLAAGGSATCNVSNNDDELIAIAAASKPTYLPGETVAVSARVLRNGVPVVGVRVYFDALKPNGINHVLLSANTDSAGDARASFVSGTGTSSIGSYQMTATATSGGLTAKGHTTFAVQQPQPATLTVNKVVLNENGGSKAASDFRFSVNGGTPVAFETDGSNVLSVPAGTYTVTEPAVSGYTASMANCSGIVLVSGASATCTITNTDLAAPALAATVGTSQATYLAGETVMMWARVLNGDVPVVGVKVNFDALKPNDINHVRLSANTDSDGYARTSFVSGTGPSSIGTYQLTATATSTGVTTSANTTFAVQSQAPQPATLTVTKVVLNNNGGSKVASDFGFSVNGGTPVAFEADGSNAVSVPAGTYTVTEPAVADYTASLANCSGIVLAAGDSATCSITNTDAPSFTATVGTSKAVYTRGETVTMSARVLNNGVAVSGARVVFDALKPNGINHVWLSGTTDSDGVARASFVSGTGPSSIGTYQLTATATSGSLTTKAYTSFAVQ